MLSPHNKNLFFSIFGILILFFVCFTVFADGGLVPCEGPDCGMNDLWTLIGNIVNFIYGVVPFVAIILIVWGGITLLTSRGETEKVSKGKKILLAVAIGLLIIYGARFLVVSFMTALGGDTGWFEQIIQ